ncbi:glycoside hydrolase 43 family protein [Sphingomonas sp. FW199]|uniref:glycoside hydrolase family 43 protein n=1 Tax=Sphingomonas sp. FW199 TaxID=3400217 RepID=UPI003CEB494F
MNRMIHAAALIVLAAAWHPAAGQSTDYTNPIIHADYSDPDVIRVGRDYYMVSSSFHLSPGIPVLHSQDLVTWRIIGHVLPRLPFGPLYDMPGPHLIDDTRSKPIGGTKYASGVWAPSIRHHDGKFFVYWATPDEGVFMATATDPAGPWTPPVHVIVAAGLEDPCPFWDEDGSAWLVHGKVGAGPLVLRRMTADGTAVLDDGIVIAEDRQALPILEGPKLYKRNGWYYIWAPIGGVGTGPQAVLRSRNIRGPYEHREVLKPGGPLDLAGPHQGGWVETPAGQGWFAHFNSTGAFGRIVHLQPVTWGADDWPVVGQAEPGATAGVPVARHARPNVGGRPQPMTMQTSDEFNGPLGLQWQWNHNPDAERWSLNARPGYLRLSAGAAQHLTTARNTLTQMLQGPRMMMTTRIDVSGMVDGQRAGLSLFGVRPSWIGIRQEGGKRRIILSDAGVETPGPVLTETAIILRAEVGPDQKVAYSFRRDGADTYVGIGQPIALSRFSWWRGSRPALFTYSDRRGGGGAIDIDWFRVDATQP